LNDLFFARSQMLALRRPYTFIVLAIFILISAGLAILRTPKDIFPGIKSSLAAWPHGEFQYKKTRHDSQEAREDAKCRSDNAGDI
jgi:hypothetical protein